MVRVERYGRVDSERLREEVASIYESAWHDMPFSFNRSQLGNFVNTFERHSKRSDFRLRLARDEGSAVGFAYGYTSEPGGWWHEHVRKALDRHSAGVWLTRSFELAELAVARDVQGTGIGGLLHESILEGLTHPAAVLSTQEENHRAMAFYRKRGWMVLTEGLRFPHRNEPFVVMALDLSARAATAAATADRTETWS